MSITSNPIVYAPGVGPDRAAVLAEELGIRTTRDLLEHYPFRYVDKTQYHEISQLAGIQGEVQIKGQITTVEEVSSGPRNKRLVANFTDGNGFIELVWFKGAKWVKKSLKLGVPMVVYGKINNFNGKISIPHPEISAPAIDQISSVLEPVYSTTEKLTRKGLQSKGLQKIIKAVLQQELEKIDDPFSEEFRTQNKLISKAQALTWIHFPKSRDHLEAAKRRIKFEEFFF